MNDSSDAITTSLTRSHLVNGVMRRKAHLLKVMRRRYNVDTPVINHFVHFTFDLFSISV